MSIETFGSRHNSPDHENRENVGQSKESENQSDKLSSNEESIDKEIASERTAVLTEVKQIRLSIEDVDEKQFAPEALALFIQLKEAVRKLGDGIQSVIEAHPRLAAAAGLAISAGVAVLCWKIMGNSGTYVDIPGHIDPTFFPNPDSGINAPEHIAAIVAFGASLLSSAMCFQSMLINHR